MTLLVIPISSYRYMKKSDFDAQKFTKQLKVSSTFVFTFTTLLFLGMYVFLTPRVADLYQELGVSVPPYSSILIFLSVALGIVGAGMSWITDPIDHTEMEKVVGSTDEMVDVRKLQSKKVLMYTLGLLFIIMAMALTAFILPIYQATELIK